MCSIALQSESMTSPSAQRRERRLNTAIAEYLQAAEAGRAPDRREFLDRHWYLADGLMAFFRDEDRLKRVAGLPRVRPRAGARPLHRPSTTGLGRELAVTRAVGQFELLNEIARGGMGVVYKARHTRLNRVVALKTILPGVSCSTEVLVKRLRAEARVVAALDHPNIVPLYEIGEEAGYPYLILKLIPGGDLDRHQPRIGRDPRAAARLIARVARTVHYAHSHGVLHRDLKPSNILLDLAGNPHVTDFGLAKCAEFETNLTQSGLILGTPAYMAPEQAWHNRGELTESVDVYGLGAVLYKLLTGRPPFHAETVYEVLDQVRDVPPASTRLYNRAIDRSLDAICLKCLEKDPARRYQSAAALSTDLERWLGGSPVRARHLSTGERGSRWFHRNRKLFTVSAVLVALVTIFVLAGVATATIICNYELARDIRPPVSAR
jgi:eukaryotic-like serine/threonine-protein kinase